MRKIVFIINPASGPQRNESFPGQVQDFCDDNHYECHIVKTTGEADFEAIQQALSDYAPDTVVACGGDGTVNLVASVILKNQLKQRIKMAIIPMGSSNGLAYNLNISTRVEEALDLLKTGHVQPVEVLLINKKHLCLHLSDVGFNALLIKHSEESAYRGKLKYLINFFRTVIYNKTFKVHIDTGQWQKSTKAEMVVLANAQKYSTGAIINPNGKFGDGKFEICVVKPYRWWQLFRLSLNLLRGKAHSTDMLNVYSTDKVTLTLKKPHLLQVDGELTGKVKRIEAEVLPTSLQFLAPPEEN